MLHSRFVQVLGVSLAILLGAGVFIHFAPRILRNEPQVVSDKPDTASPTRETVLCEEPVVDFGEICRRPLQSIEHDFPITNLSNQPLELEVKERSCTCASANLSPQIVPPGGKAVLSVVWHVPATVGRQSFSLAVGGKDSHVEMLYLQGTVLVRDLVRVQPPQLNLGELKPGQVRTASLEVFGPKEMRLSESGVRVLNADAAELSAVVDVLNRRVNVRAHSNSGKGRMRYVLALDTGLSRQPVIHVPVTAEHSSRFVTGQRALVIRDPSEKKVHAITVESISGEPCQVERVECDPPELFEVEQKQLSVSAARLEFILKLAENSNPYSTGKVRIFLKGCDIPVEIAYLVMWKH